jgi:hypothetical protein
MGDPPAPRAAETTAAGTAAAAALARKYAALAGLRARRDGGGRAATRDELRALAAEFPGALRELDTLGPTEIARRAAACAAAAAGGAEEPWMAWIAAYHQAMREALGARRRGGARAGAGGRLNVTVLRALAARFGVPATTIAGVLFPVRRASPYRL